MPNAQPPAPTSSLTSSLMPPTPTSPWTLGSGPPAATPATRVSQTDRDRVVELLKGAYVDGRLDVDEFQDRTQNALAARVPTDLAAVLTGVAPRTAPSRPLPAAAPDERGLAATVHLLGLFTSFLGPLVVALARGRNGFARDQAVEALNFQLTVALVAVALVIPTVVTFGVASLLYIPLGVADVVLSAAAAASAAGGTRYRYPGTLRLVT